jgi:hypothetical protein
MQNTPKAIAVAGGLSPPICRSRPRCARVPITLLKHAWPSGLSGLRSRCRRPSSPDSRPATGRSSGAPRASNCFQLPSSRRTGAPGMACTAAVRLAMRSRRGARLPHDHIEILAMQPHRAARGRPSRAGTNQGETATAPCTTGACLAGYVTASALSCRITASMRSKASA